MGVARFWALNGLTGAIIDQGNVAGDVEVSPTLSPQGDLYFYDSYLTLYSVSTTSRVLQIPDGRLDLVISLGLTQEIS